MKLGNNFTCILSNSNNFPRLKAWEIIIRILTKCAWNCYLISLITIWLHILIWLLTLIHVQCFLCFPNLQTWINKTCQHWSNTEIPWILQQSEWICVQFISPARKSMQAYAPLGAIRNCDDDDDEENPRALNYQTEVLLEGVVLQSYTTVVLNNESEEKMNKFIKAWKSYNVPELLSEVCGGFVGSSCVTLSDVVLSDLAAGGSQVFSQSSLSITCCCVLSSSSSLFPALQQAIIMHRDQCCM